MVAHAGAGAVAMVEKGKREEFRSESGSRGRVVSPARSGWNFCDALGSEGRL
jgi:hypothetical protein